MSVPSDQNWSVLSDPKKSWLSDPCTKPAAASPESTASKLHHVLLRDMLAKVHDATQYCVSAQGTIRTSKVPFGMCHFHTCSNTAAEVLIFLILPYSMLPLL